ncbi:hypothetical protein CLAIMM_08615 [Cladophialophora immunda]|nr:hypothetical protein CLAIMM_08615 [Cladophialophora immunda]
MIYTSSFPPISVPTNVSVSQFLLKVNPDDTDSGKPILRDFDDPTQYVTYGGIRRLASQGAAGLKSVLGMKEGDIVCILAGNSANWAVLAHSIIWGGGCFSAINVLATSHELVHYFSISEPTIIATSPAHLDKVNKALMMSPANSPRPKIIIVGDGATSRTTSPLKVFPQDMIDDRRAPLPPYDLSQTDARQIPAAMCFSSGTSGKPKGVLLSHYGIIAHLLAMRTTDPFLYNGFHREVFFPQFAHIYGIIAVIMLVPFVGSYVEPMKQFDLKRYAQRCAEIRATIMRLVPSTAVSIVKDPQLQNLDLKSVQYILCSGAALQSQVVAQLYAIMAETHIIQGYGMSEGSLTTLRGHWGSKKAGSCGKPFAGASIRVVDDNYKDVQPNMPGECLLRSPTLFMGYKNNPEETKSCFRDGWFCTGDIARVDEDGFFWLTDRKKELIKYKGNQVPPAEIEDVLLSHSKVRDAAVCGVYDESEQTEIPIGYVVIDKPKTEAELANSLQEIRQYVDTRVAPYKRLRGGIHYIDVIPKGPTGKVLRRQLPARIKAEMEKIGPKL